MQKTEIDIVLALYNGEKYIYEQIDSIITQKTTISYRLIIGDDGSSDFSKTIIENIIRDTNAPIHYVPFDGKRLGPARRFEALLSFTTAPHVMLCDQDDLWLPNKIEETYNYFRAVETNNTEPVAVYTDLILVDSTLQTLSDSMLRDRNISGNLNLNQLLVNNPATGCTMMLNRALIDAALPLPNGIYMHDWWFALVAAYSGKLKFLDLPTMKYRQHDNNVLGYKKSGNFERIKAIAEIFETGRYEPLFSQIESLRNQLIGLGKFKEIYRLNKILKFKNYPNIITRILVWKLLRNE